MWALPPEPGPEITAVWDRGGCRWDRDAPGHWRWAAPGRRRAGHWHPDYPEPLILPWNALLSHHGPLTATPPTTTEETP
jgi:hypothetical protein